MRYKLAVAIILLLHHTTVVSLTTKTTTTTTTTIHKGLLDRVRHNDRAGEAVALSAVPFIVGSNNNKPMGFVLPQFAKELSKFPSVFSVSENEVKLLDQCAWHDDAGDGSSLCHTHLVSQRSEAVRKVLKAMRKEDVVPALRGWRDELFEVRESFHSPPVLIVERAAAVLFGVPAYGVFVNGYTCEGTTGTGICSRPTHVWVGRRSADKQTWPSRFDSLAAGGLATGFFPKQAILNECAEEAGIVEAQLQEKIRAVSAISYTGFNDDRWGLKRDVLFCFDLELPPTFEPTPLDGEMEGFEKIPIERLVGMLAAPINEDDSDNLWKPNVGVVLIDFLVRHGMLDADDPSFLEIIDALRTARCY